MKVSVCVASYNGGCYLKEQVSSILNQKYTVSPIPDLEIIISDDGSIDGSIDEIVAMNCSSIIIIEHKERTQHKFYKSLFAATKNFENALRYATGDVVMLCDQDDIWYPNKIDAQLMALKESDFCACSFDWVIANGTRFDTTIYKKSVFFSMCCHFPWYGFSYAFTRSFLNKIMPFPNVPQHDMYIGLYAMLEGNITLIEKPLAGHRCFGVSGENGKRNTSDSSLGTPNVIRVYYRLKMIVHVLARFVCNKMIRRL